MLGQMRGNHVRAVSSAGLTVDAIRDAGVRDAPDISALAARSPRSATVPVWHCHDDDLPAPAAPVTPTIRDLPTGTATVTHHRIDESHSNSYAAWLRMGSPPQPSPAQYAELERASELEELRPARGVSIGADGLVTESFDVPRKSVSFVRAAW